jgi:hypothetical protein
VQLEPGGLALAVKMNKGMGMPRADVAAVLQDGFQVQVNRNTFAGPWIGSHGAERQLGLLCWMPPGAVWSTASTRPAGMWRHNYADSGWR